MRAPIILMALICIANISTTLQAQSINKKSKEIGLFVETTMNNYSFSNTTLGIQYKKETKTNKAIRFQVLYQQKNYKNEPYNYEMVSDTLKETQLIQKNRNVFVGFGIEQQRQFYKRVFLYASLDARIGYGNSSFLKTISSTVIDTSNGVYYQHPISQLSTPELISSIQSNRFAFDILPSIGSKLIFQNLVLGFETGLNISNGYLTQKGLVVKQFSMYDLDISFFQYRAYVNYRF